MSLMMLAIPAPSSPACSSVMTSGGNTRIRIPPRYIDQQAAIEASLNDLFRGHTGLNTDHEAPALAPL